MTENNNMEQPTYTYDEVFRAINKLAEEEKDFILQWMNIYQIMQIVDSQKSMEENCKILDLYAKAYGWMSTLIQKIYVNINEVTEKVEDIVSDYKKLNIDQKKTATLALMNNSDFQKNCSEVLIKDFERISKGNPTVMLLDNLLGFSKHYKKCIELGIGCDHKYEV